MTRKGSMVVCPVCGCDFYVMPCNLWKAKYCSRACQSKAQEQGYTKECRACGKEFVTVPSRDANFCSNECYLADKQPTKTCKVCGKNLRISALTYCSKKCMSQGQDKGTFKPCEICGKEIRVLPSDGEQKRFCSRKCADEGHKVVGPGATFKRPDGYVAVYYPTHPDASKSGMVMQHRLVAEEKYGRRILKTEQIHHLNGIRDDNQPANLEVISPAAHARISNQQKVNKRKSQKAQLEEYRRKFGPLT